MNTRRDLLRVIGYDALVPARDVFAQQTTKLPRLGILWHAANAEQEKPYLEALLLGLQQLGYTDGKTIELVHRFPDDVPERFAAMAAELIALKSDVLVGAGPNASLALKNATQKISVVFTLSPDPVASQLVSNLRRPGGNVTGLTNFGFQLGAKRLEYLKDTFPKLARVGLLVNPNAQVTRQYVQESQDGAAQLKLSAQPFEARTIEEIEPALDAMVKARMQAAVVMSGGGIFFSARDRVAQMAIARRLPLMVYSRETFEGGALMSYGPDQAAIFKRAASYVDKILKGTKTGDIPVENPTQFELLINLKTAKAIGVRIPQSILARAERVIE